MAWYDEVFDGKYDRFTFHLFTPQRNQREADFIRSALQLKPGEEVLDLACGFGRHAIPLARKGIRVVGLDRSERYIEMARKHAGDLQLEFVCGDMRTIEFEERFDAAYCFFSSFGFFDDETNFDVLCRVARALRPAGRFLLDIRSRENICSSDGTVTESYEFEQDGRECAMISMSSFDPVESLVRVKLKLFGYSDKPEEMSFSVRLYSFAELRWLMKQAGMEIIKQFGDCDASPYSLASPRLIVVARRVDAVTI